MLAVRQAATIDTDPFVEAEAGFALWDMQVRERRIPDAVVTARKFQQDFPDNPELTTFLGTHDKSARK